jgi:hypothetical protein
MKVEFADSFGKSLKRLIWHQHPVYKFYEIFRYKIPMFFENLWFFRKELWEFRSWDYGYNLQMFRRSLEKTVNTIEVYGNEVDESRMKKVEKMKRVIELLNHVRSDSYIEMAEKELGEIKHLDWEFEDVPDKPGYKQLVDKENDEDYAHNRKVYNRAQEIEDQEWKELWKILEGQDNEEYRKLYDAQSDEEKHKKDLWYEWFDGSGMKGWWD